MPPGPAYNWLCVLTSTTEIISHALQYKVAQIAPKAAGAYLHPRKRPRTEDTDVYRGSEHSFMDGGLQRELNKHSRVNEVERNASLNVKVVSTEST